MSGTMSLHELPVPGVGTEIPAQTRELVDQKYDQTTQWAADAKKLMDDYFKELTDYINKIGDIDCTIPVDEFNIDIPIDLVGLIRGIPDNPITDADYNIQIPDELVWNYVEEPYVSDLKEQFKERLQDILNNGGGALAEVENDIFLREQERDLLVNEDAKTQAMSNWAKRNHDMPALGAFSQLARIDQDYQNKLLDKSRQIAEESRKVEIQMEQNTFENINKVEALEIEHHNKVQDRKLQAAKAIVDYGLAIVDAQIKKLQAKVSAYAESVKAYVAHTDAVSKVVQVYVAIIEARIKYITAKIQASIAELEAQIKEDSMKHGLATENWRAQLQVSAQIAASAMAAFHASANLSGSFSGSISESLSVSESYSHSEDLTPA